MRLQIYATICAVGLLFLSCRDKGMDPIQIDKPDSVQVRYALDTLGLSGKFVVRLKYAAPYLYACAASEGVWKRNVQTLTPWESLGLADSALGKYTNVGAWDMDVRGQNILVAYKAYGAKPRPDSATAIWGSTNGGSTWFKSDYGIEETFDYNVEGNIITSVRFSPFDPQLAIAVYERAVYRSTDGGLNWQLVLGQRGLGYNYGELRWNPSKADEIWNFGETSFFSPFLRCLENSGSSIRTDVDFASLGFPGDGGVTDVVFKSNSQTIYAATTNGLIKSTDGGSIWSLWSLVLPDSGYVNVLATNPLDSTQLILAGGKSVYSTTDGASSAQLLQQLSVNFIFWIELDSAQDRIFLGTGSGVFSMALK